jgi:hypothetical protein
MLHLMFLLSACNLVYDVPAMEAALARGDVQQLARYVHEHIEVLDRHDLKARNKKEALAFLRSFFREHPPVDYRLKHDLTSNGDTRCRIGELKTKGQVFRVYLYSRQQDGIIWLEEIRIKPIP